MEGGTDISEAPAAVMEGNGRPMVGQLLLSRQAPVELEARGPSPSGDMGEERPDRPGPPAAEVEAAADGRGQQGRGSTADMLLTADPPRLALTRRNLGAPRFSRNSLTQQYYGNSAEVADLPPMFSPESGRRKQRIKQSRRLPYWIWFVLAKSLGIKMHNFDRPIFGTFMHSLTLLFAFGFAVTHAWFKVYDIVSNETKETVLRGSVSIVIVLYWCSLGMYANKLAGRLFTMPHFLDSVRLHSKTIFKISAAGIIVLLGLAAIILNCFGAKDIFDGSMCKAVALNVAVCKVLYVMRVLCSILTIVWNLLVAIVLLSVCRTHTIGIRRFIRELEEDGRMYESYRRNMMMQGPLLPASRNRDEDESSDDTILWDDEFAQAEGNLQPTSYQNTQASPRQSPSPRNTSRHTSQASVATASTSVVPDSDPQPQVSNSTNAQNCPSLSPTPNSSASQANHNPNILTVEAEVAPPMHTSAAPCGENPHPVEQTPRLPAQPDVPRETHTPPGDQNVNCPPDTNKVPSKSCRPIIIIREGSIVIPDGPEGSEIVTELETNQNFISADPPSFASRSTRSGLDSPQQSTRVELSSPRRVPSSMTEVTESGDNVSLGPHLMTSDDILLSYWKINCRLRATSMVMQRWLCAIITFILVWCFTFIFYWMKHDTTILGIIEFTMPILILPIICSAYGEVNFEGRRMLKCICPTHDRIEMMYYLLNAPLELTAFGFAVNYGVMVTALGALGLAFITKLILQEMND